MHKTTYRTTPWMLSLPMGVLSAGANQPARAVTPWVTGDVFAGVGNGTYQVYDNTGVFKEAISDGLGGITAGCAFNPSLTRLYTTNFIRTKVFVYDDPSPHLISQIIDTGLTSPGGRSGSVVFDAGGSFYVGHADGNRLLHKYDAAGNLLMTFSPQVERLGAGWIDLAADQRTMLYTSGGGLIKRFDVGDNVQLPDFASIGNRSFAFRLLLPADGRGGLVVANTADIKRLNGSGTVVQTYDVPGENGWFSVSLDPNRTSFWAGSTLNFYRFNLTTGAVEVGPSIQVQQSSCVASVSRVRLHRRWHPRPSPPARGSCAAAGGATCPSPATSRRSWALRVPTRSSCSCAGRVLARRGIQAHSAMAHRRRRRGG
jgi:hypothetical protein